MGPVDWKCPGFYSEAALSSDVEPAGCHNWRRKRHQHRRHSRFV